MHSQTILGSADDEEHLTHLGYKEKEDTVKEVSNPGQKGLVFPQRSAPSFQDRLKAQLTEGLESAAIERNTLVLSWMDQISRLRENFPLFTALNNRATILILFSDRDFSNLEQVQQCIVSGSPLHFQAKAFLKADYPFLRCHLLFPINPLGSLVLEAALDVADGDIQDFIEAVIEDEHIDFIIGHTNDLSGGMSINVACSAEGIAQSFMLQVRSVLDAYRPHMKMDQFRAAQKVMFDTFKGESDGIERDKLVSLRLVGKAKNSTIMVENV